MFISDIARAQSFKDNCPKKPLAKTEKSIQCCQFSRFVLYKHLPLFSNSNIRLISSVIKSGIYYYLGKW